MTPGQPILWRPQPGPQTALLSCPVPDIFFGGARGGGKSQGLLGDWLSHANEYAQYAKGLFIRQSMPELEELQAEALKIYPQVGGTWQAGKRSWHFRNGANLKMRWLERVEDAARYQGHGYTYIGIDELGNFKTPEAVDRLRATLRSAAGVPCVMRATGNPGGPGHAWIKSRYITNHAPMVPFFDEEMRVWRVFIPSSLRDNPILLSADPDYVNRLRSSGPSWLVKAWLEGDWDVSISGKLFLRDWWQYFTAIIPDFLTIFQVWDTGIKVKEENDPSACLTIGLHRIGWYVLDAWEGRVEYPELEMAVKQQYAKWESRGCSQILIEDAASGSQLIQSLRRAGRLPIKPVRHKNKIGPAYAVAPLIEAGKVFLPQDAPWVADFIEQFAAFPNGPHDEFVDCLSFAIQKGPTVEMATPKPQQQQSISFLPQKSKHRKPPARPEDDEDDLRWNGGRK